MKTLVFILLLIVNLSLLGLMIYLLFKIPQFRFYDLGAILIFILLIIESLREE